MIKISILHPSRWRPDTAAATYKEWIAMADHPESIEYILVVDDDDNTLLRYYECLEQAQFPKMAARFTLMPAPSRTPVSAANEAAKLISDTSELLVEVLDDVSSCSGWDTKLLAKLAGVDNFTVPKSIGTHDGLRDYGVVFTQPIMNRARYTSKGYFIYPGYTSMSADCDFTESARVDGCLIDAPEILFKHNHYSIGLSPHDATYARNNNPHETTTNQDVLIRRRACGFKE